MLTNDQQKQFSSIFEELSNQLDITKEEHDAAVRSYNAVAKHLTRTDSELSVYSPEILPQGSFMIGTIIKPIVDGDDLDIDLVCQLKGKQDQWTQKDVKQIIGKELKEHGIFSKLLEIPDGRRCWTMRYRDNAREKESQYHMDILPSIVDTDYHILYESLFSAKGLSGTEIDQLDELAIRITDKERNDYTTEMNHLKWLKSNPFGYAKWFEDRSIVTQLGMINETRFLSEWVKPVPERKEEKLPLQRVIQIMKRHRDIYYSEREDKDDKPISIIITTLAARAYKGEADIIEALQNVVSNMLDYIIEEHDYSKDKMIKRVNNPVNELENFADKWLDYPQREKNFYEWHQVLQDDLNNIFNQRGLGYITESLSPFGKKVAQQVFTNLGEKTKNMREKGNLKMAGLSGTLGSKGDKVEDHNFHD